jgi:hypothetical protein
MNIGDPKISGGIHFDYIVLMNNFPKIWGDRVLFRKFSNIFFFEIFQKIGFEKFEKKS